MDELLSYEIKNTWILYFPECLQYTTHTRSTTFISFICRLPTSLQKFCFFRSPLSHCSVKKRLEIISVLFLMFVKVAVKHCKIDPLFKSLTQPIKGQKLSKGYCKRISVSMKKYFPFISVLKINGQLKFCYETLSFYWKNIH